MTARGRRIRCSWLLRRVLRGMVGMPLAGAGLVVAHGGWQARVAVAVGPAPAARGGLGPRRSDAPGEGRLVGLRAGTADEGGQPGVIGEKSLAPVLGRAREGHFRAMPGRGGIERLADRV